MTRIFSMDTVGLLAALVVIVLIVGIVRIARILAARKKSDTASREQLSDSLAKLDESFYRSEITQEVYQHQRALILSHIEKADNPHIEINEMRAKQGVSKKALLTVVLITGALILAAVFLRIILANITTEYTTVNAMVVRSEAVTELVGKSAKTFYYVDVVYQGTTYEVHNLYNNYSFREGQEATVFLSDGNMYANVEGVQTSTPFAAVAITISALAFIGVIATITCLILYLRAEKAKKAAFQSASIT